MVYDYTCPDCGRESLFLEGVLGESASGFSNTIGVDDDGDVSMEFGIDCCKCSWSGRYRIEVERVDGG